MSSNHQSGPVIPPVPSGQCAAYADLLPVLDEPGTDARAVTAVRAHLATCGHCRARMTSFRQLDAAVARAVGPAATPRKRTEDIMRDILREDATHTETAQRALATPAASNTAPPRGPHLPHLPQAPRRLWSGLASVAAVLAVVLLAAILFAGHVRSGEPAANGTPAPGWGGPGSETTLAGISMVSPTEGWAVGQATPANATNGNQARPLLLHYQNGVWTSTRLSIPGQLTAIAMVSASDGWAMGTQGLIAHYNGTVWQRVTGPTQGDFTQVRMLSATDGWAVYNAFAHVVLYHYDGHAWTAQPLPANIGAITEISMISPAEGWAIGTLANIGPAVPTAITPTVGNTPPKPTPPTTVILRYHDGAWSVGDTLTNPPSQFSTLASISMTSTDDGWAAGGISTLPTPSNPTIQTTMLLLHYANGAWHQLADPLAGTAYHATDFVQVSMRTADDGWITASQNPAATVPVALHYDGTRWSVVAPPDISHSSTWYITGLAFTPAGDLWAVGARLSDATTGAPDGHGGFTPTITPVILHEQGGTWSVVMK